MIKSRMMRWAGHVARRRWVDNIKTVLRETEWGGVDWITLVKDRKLWRALVNTVMI
jgi:hypothetical protein